MQEPNLDKILQLQIGFRDLERHRTYPDYKQGLKKILFAMIRQLGLPIFLITLTNAELLWTPLLKALYELNASALKLPDLSSLECTHIA